MEHKGRADRESVPGHLEGAREARQGEAGDREEAEAVRRQSGDQRLARRSRRRADQFGFVVLTRLAIIDLADPCGNRGQAADRLRRIAAGP